MTARTTTSRSSHPARHRARLATIAITATTVATAVRGGTRWYDSNGKLVLRNPGSVRWEELVDNSGTPTDPSDDEYIEFLGVLKPSTGRNDLDGRDFCEDLLLFTT